MNQTTQIPTDSNISSDHQTESIPKRSVFTNCINILINGISFLFFWWVNPIIRKGMRTTLTTDDLFELERSDDGAYLCKLFYHHWNKSSTQRSKFRLWIVFFLSFSHIFILIAILALIETCLKLANTLLLGKLIEFFELYQSETIDLSQETGHLYAGLLSGSVLLAALVHHQLYYHSTKLGMTILSMMISSVFRKIKNLHSSYAKQGYILNLVSNDIESFRNAFTMIHILFIAPLELVFVTFFLVQKIYWIPTLTGLLTLFLMIPIQALLSKWIAVFRKKLVQSRDVLLRTVSDAFTGIQVIKYYSWEAPFQKRIQHERSHLLDIFYQISWIKCFNESCAFFSSLIVSTIAFITYHYQGHVLNASKVFSALPLFFLVQVDITDMFPRVIEFLAKSFVSVQRLEAFLDMPQVQPRISVDLKDAVVHIENCKFKRSTLVDDDIVEDIQEFGQSSRSFTLVIDELMIPKGRFTMLIGPVGSGKSTLISSILGEIDPMNDHGKLHVSSSIGYASQQAWLFNGTLLENILMGRQLDSTRLSRVLFICCLKTDLMSMPLGLKTIVGERGVSLSGGQRTRISLARTLYDYHNIDFFLLDDVLSAVDNIVGNHVLAELKTLCKETNTSVLLVTHQTQHLDHAEHIISLSNGKIIFNGGSSDFFEQEGDQEISLYGLTDEDELERRISVMSESDPRDDEIDEDIELPSHDEQPAFLSEGVLGTSCTTATMMHRVSFSRIGYNDLKKKEHQPILKRPLSVRSMRMRSYSTGYTTRDKQIAKSVKAKLKDWKQTEPKHDSLVDTVLNVSTELEEISKLISSSLVEDVAVLPQEDKQIGKISYKTYVHFMKLSGSGLMLLLLLLASIIPEGLFVFANEWLALWCDLDPASQLDQSYKIYPIVLIILTLITMIFSIIRAAFFFRIVMYGCAILFEAMLASVLSAPITFFQTNPIGRILNRFSKDQSFIDEELAWTFFDAVQCCLMLFGTIAIMCIVNPWTSIAVPFILVFYGYIRHCYLKSSREIKRCESISRSPVYSLLASTLEGLELLRSFSFDILDTIETKFIKLQNVHTRGLFSYDSVGRWMAFWLDVSSAIFFFICTHGSVIIGNTLNPAMVGLALSYVMHLIGLVQWCTKQLAEVENMMTSVERIIVYSNLPSEMIELNSRPPKIGNIVSSQAIRSMTLNVQASPIVAVENMRYTLPENWPEHGFIKINNLNLTIPNRNIPILSSISCTFNPKENVAIVGRTGAGKSSFLSVFLRLVEPFPSGCIVIDGVNISAIPLSKLRNRISVIPQDPVLFHGTIRFNLDPYNESSVTDNELWNVLEQVRLDKIIRELPNGLDTDLISGSHSFSVGEKQLFCLARAILRRSSLIFMDEATANIDMETSDYIQSMIKRIFSNSNVFTIAHRLQTVIRYDRVMVLDQGHLIELDTPWNLLNPKRYPMSTEELASLDEESPYWDLNDPENEQSLFARMIREMGIEEQRKMKKAAFDEYYSRIMENNSYALSDSGSI